MRHGQARRRYRVTFQDPYRREIRTFLVPASRQTEAIAIGRRSLQQGIVWRTTGVKELPR